MNNIFEKLFFKLDKIMNGLIERGIFVRMPFVEPQNRCIRISAGRTKDLDLFEASLPQILDSIR